MTKAQEKDLFTKWALCGPIEQRLMIGEYLRVSEGGACSKDRFLNFLKDKLQIAEYWEKMGLA
jgi:hypothetical protein